MTNTSGGRTTQCVTMRSPQLFRRPDPAFFRALSALCELPNVVVYERLVMPDGKIRYTYISEGAYDLFGVSAEEILSNPNALFSCHSADYSACLKNGSSRLRRHSRYGT